MPADFHEVSFPTGIALGARGGPVRRTDIVTLASGREQRNGRWADSRRHYDAGLGIRTLEALEAVIAFFEERAGRLYGFRFHDRTDCRSGSPSAVPVATDCAIGTGDGATGEFQLVKTYGGAFAPWTRRIRKPVANSVLVAVGGSALPLSAFACDPTTGLVTLAVPPAAGVAVTAGFSFDVPVRFDSDTLEIDLLAFEAGAVPSVPLVEISV